METSFTQSVLNWVSFRILKNYQYYISVFNLEECITYLEFKQAIEIVKMIIEED